MLKGFLAGLKDHLTPGGEGWLILSDFAEHLGLRPRGEVLRLIEAAGLKLISATTPGRATAKAMDMRPAASGARRREDLALAPDRRLT